MIGVALGALTLGGCHPAKIGERRNERTLVTAQRLDCPERQDDLTRTSMSPNGRTCAYTGQDGREISLQLMALNARAPRAALDDLEAELKRTGPQLASPDRSGVTALASASSNATASDDGDGDNDEAHIDLPGFHIDAQGDRAQVSLPGVHIDANDGKAVVRVEKPGGTLVSIHADDDGAEIRTGDITEKNVDATYLLASKGRDGSERGALGYVARGPVGGPLVVATVKSRGEKVDADDTLKSVRRLVGRNVHRAPRIT